MKAGNGLPILLTTAIIIYNPHIFQSIQTRIFLIKRIPILLMKKISYYGLETMVYFYRKPLIGDIPWKRSRL